DLPGGQRPPADARRPGAHLRSAARGRSLDDRWLGCAAGLELPALDFRHAARVAAGGGAADDQSVAGHPEPHGPAVVGVRRGLPSCATHRPDHAGHRLAPKRRLPGRPVRRRLPAHATDGTQADPVWRPPEPAKNIGTSDDSMTSAAIFGLMTQSVTPAITL